MNINTGQVYPDLPSALADAKKGERVVELPPAPDPVAGLLLLYSEWLDVNGLMKTPKQSGDPRTHDELIKAFKNGHGRVVE